MKPTTRYDYHGIDGATITDAKVINCRDSQYSVVIVLSFVMANLSAIPSIGND